MSSSKDVPDAWDDDWVDSQAHNNKDPEDPAASKKVTKSERRRQQLELNKKLWEEAEAPDAPYFVQRANDVPLQSGFAPSIRVLSRRPNSIIKKSSTPGFEQVPQQDYREEEVEGLETIQPTVEERAENARRDRAERQRKYDEVRQRLFGAQGVEQTNPSSHSTIVNSEASTYQPVKDGGRIRSAMRGSPRQLFNPTSSHDRYASSSGADTSVESAPVQISQRSDSSGRGGRSSLRRTNRESS